MKKFLLSLGAIVLAITGSCAITVPCFAGSKETKEAACAAAYGNSGPDYDKCVNGSTTDGVLQKVKDILNVVFLVVGILAVIMIIIGGVFMMISAGDPGKIKRAKDTIMYSVIGLIITLLAFAIVNFVVGMF